ncbi:hypothetical protein AQUCO_00300264v1 [Aquilegia coerulea]|uniref:Galactose oxidase-like Early set domain-containing protein n=1 Tax=Aquilegia coerulea TaxID=218851 RepID=A0A2G5EY43_AQUCA|nr:hypothetical protein AQUCO_00300264v1 [Aquilegia coerulea]
MEFLFLFFILILIFLPLVRCQFFPLSSIFTGGEWRILHRSIGISAMHMQLLHNNQVVMFDRTDFGPSNLSLPFGRCRVDANDIALKNDCTAHSLLYDIGTNIYRPLMVQTDTFCSSGAVLPDGTFIQIGGYNDGDRTIRTLTPCITNDCDWIEHPEYLNERRWYATNQRLPDGRIIIVGGRRQFNYEFYPKGSGDDNTYELSFLRETNDDQENNLYPFLHLLPNGNLFIFANTRAILFDYRRNQIVREFPQIPGGDPRNYPSSGSSVLLPIRFSDNPGRFIEAEVLICGGAPKGSAANALRGTFVLATPMCGRLRVTDSNPAWEMEQMPNRRVMGDMLILPTGDIIIINGARSGTAGWELGRHPVTIPLVYRPDEPSSNPHTNYSFTNVRYPTELSLESFSPPYLAPEYDNIRPRITACPEIINYGQTMSITFFVPEYRSASHVSVRILAPSFTTHSLAMNQRMVMLTVVAVRQVVIWTYEITAIGPALAEVAPSGYYLMFVVHDGTPSSGTWVKLQ